MNTTGASQAGHTIEQILCTLTEVAGQLEQLAMDVMSAQTPASAQPAEQTDTEMRVRAGLLHNVVRGNESFSTFELADAVGAYLSSDGGTAVAEREIRKHLPKLLRELFDAKPSCSLKRDGRFVRGFRGLAAREYPMEEILQRCR